MQDEAAEIGDELGGGGSITWIAAGQDAASHCQQKIHHGGTETGNSPFDRAEYSRLPGQVVW